MKRKVNLRFYERDSATEYRTLSLDAHVFETPLAKVVIHRHPDYGGSNWYASEYRSGASLGNIVADRTIERTLSNAKSLLDIKSREGILFHRINAFVSKYGEANN